MGTSAKVIFQCNQVVKGNTLIWFFVKTPVRVGTSLENLFWKSKKAVVQVSASFENGRGCG